MTVDTVAPTAPVITSVSDDTGTPGDHITSDNTLTLAGTAEAGSTVNVYEGATLIGSATADANGVWSIAPDMSDDQMPAPTSNTATHFGFGTNWAMSGGLGLTPVAWHQSEFFASRFSRWHHDASSQPTLATETGATPADANNAWGVTTPPLSDGVHVFTVSATDAAGNTKRRHHCHRDGRHGGAKHADRGRLHRRHGRARRHHDRHDADDQRHG